MGPAPIYFDGIVAELVDENKIKVERVRMSPFHENDTVIYKPLSKTDYSFTDEEKSMLDE